MGTINSGIHLLDASYVALGGVDASDRSYAALPYLVTLRAVVAADITGATGATIAMGAPRVPANPYGGEAVPTRFRAVAARLVAAGAIAPDAANNATFTVTSYPTAGASPLPVATITSNAAGIGTVVAGAAKELAITLANAVLPVDGNVALVLTKGGTGVTVPAGTLVELDLVPAG